MRKVLLMAGLLAVVVFATYGGPTGAAASQTCTATCPSGAVLQCNVANGTCSSTGATVTCCGQTHSNCAAIDAWNACRNACFDDYDDCRSQCRVRIPCLDDCNAARTACLSSCGTRPTTTWSC
jgi:hypothetical protein